MSLEILYNFKRKEQKYLLTEAQRSAVWEELSSRFCENEFGRSRVVSVYYDNDDFELINRSIEKPRYKEKLRVRTYDPTFSEEMPVFAEIKKKYDGIVYKRRVSGPYKEIKQLLQTGGGHFVLPDSDIQIQRELRWMIRRYRLEPKIWVSCMRVPYQALDGSDLRITFDSGLRYQTEQPDLCYPGRGEAILPEGLHVMEIKSSGGLPLWLSETLNRHQIYPQGFSKVGTAFQNQLMQSLIQE